MKTMPLDPIEQLQAGGLDKEGRLQISLPLDPYRVPADAIQRLLQTTWNEFMAASFAELQAMKSYLDDQARAFNDRIERHKQKMVREKVIEYGGAAELFIFHAAMFQDRPDDGFFEGGFKHHFEQMLSEHGIDAKYSYWFEELGLFRRRLQALRFRQSMLRKVMWHRAVLGDRRSWEELDEHGRTEMANGRWLTEKQQGDHARNDEIHQEFWGRRDAGERAASIFEDLEVRRSLSRKRLESIVYPRDREGSPLQI